MLQTQFTLCCFKFYFLYMENRYALVSFFVLFLLVFTIPCCRNCHLSSYKRKVRVLTSLQSFPIFLNREIEAKDAAFFQ